METDDSGVLLQNVKDTKGAIGYVALSYLTGDAGVATVAIDGAEPTLENTYAGKYPVWTFEHMYTKEMCIRDRFQAEQLHRKVRLLEFRNKGQAKRL